MVRVLVTIALLSAALPSAAADMQKVATTGFTKTTKPLNLAQILSTYTLVDRFESPASSIIVTGCTAVGPQDKQELRERRYKVDVSLERAQIEPLDIGPACERVD
jgi:hypothetical protein